MSGAKKNREAKRLTFTTGAGEVALPVEDVELSGKVLRSASGGPLVVRCEFVNEELILALTEASPGHAPEVGIVEKKSTVETAKALMKYAPGILEAGCSLIGPDGSEQRPAFHFGAAPKNGSLPGRFLTMAEKLRLFLTILRLSGYIGGAADSVRFPGDKRTRGADGEGTVDAGEGNGDAAGDAPVRGEGEDVPAA
jgi:hypothetical protein